MKTVCKVLEYNDIVFAGTLDACIKEALKCNKKANAHICTIEVWEKTEDYYLTTLDSFWS